MNIPGTQGKFRWYRGGIFFVLLILGLLAYQTFSTGTMGTRVTVLRICLAVVFLAGSLYFRFKDAQNPYWKVLFALFTVIVAQLIDLHFSHWLPDLVGVSLNTPAGDALDKLESSFLIAALIILLTKISGGDLASLYLKRGKLRSWLLIGGGAFAFFALTSFPAASGLFAARDLSIARVIPWIPWILIFVFANALSEELLFRGLLLGRFEPFVGRLGSIILASVIFTFWHLGANYTPEMIMFLVFVFLLGFSTAYITQKTDSLWGAVLLHAGMDIPIIIGIFSTL
jgi:membrane protease YdiL (CAAX protease family)